MIKHTVKHKGFLQSFMCNENENIHETAVITAKITSPSYYPSYNPLPIYRLKDRLKRTNPPKVKKDFCVALKLNF